MKNPIVFLAVGGVAILAIIVAILFGIVIYRQTHTAPAHPVQASSP